ncbi:MAG: PadR family transcriptional regulator [Canibacter sp.]
MALIRDGLLALATAGAGYGLQLRNELASRTGRALNGGQVYATLDRLVRDDLIAEIGRTYDDLALLSATPRGRESAHEWLAQPEPHWEDMVSKVLLSLSLPNHSSLELISVSQKYWASTAHPDSTNDGQLRVSADKILAEAALTWLSKAGDADDSGWSFSQERPPKGRRPKYTETASISGNYS